MASHDRASRARRWLAMAIGFAICSIWAIGAVASAPAQEPDTTPPETTITAGPADGTITDNDAPMFAWSSSEPSSTFACVVDGAAIASCDDAFRTGALPGPHSFSVAATDPAGNTDPTPARARFTIRLEGPSLLELSGCPVDGELVVGSNGADTRVGTSATDIMYGRDGDDILRGASGADCIAGQSGNDQLFGGRGGDFLFGGAGNDRVAGESGNDTVYGDSGNDLVDGGSGGDRLSDSSGRDTFAGGPGNDLVDARDSSRGGRRIADRISCGPGRYDVALVDRVDHVASDCERVRRR